jgi:hypothetical protein
VDNLENAEAGLHDALTGVPRSMDVTLVVRRRFPTYDATVRANRSCDVVRDRLQAFDFDGEAAFVLRSRRRGLHGSLRPWIEGGLAPNELGGCDVRFRVAYPRLWWVLDVGLFVALVAEMFLSTESFLAACLALLVAITFLSLPLKGLAFARRVKKLLAT